MTMKFTEAETLSKISSRLVKVTYNVLSEDEQKGLHHQSPSGFRQLKRQIEGEKPRGLTQKHPVMGGIPFPKETATVQLLLNALNGECTKQTFRVCENLELICSRISMVRDHQLSPNLTGLRKDDLIQNDAIIRNFLSEIDPTISSQPLTAVNITLSLRKLKVLYES